MMKTILASLCALPLVACVQQDASPKDIDKALPTADQVSIKLKDSDMAAVRSAGQRVTAGTENLGGLANWYVATRDVTRLFNGGSAWVLTLIHSIVQFPVTSTDGDTYTWGPWSDGALATTEYKLDVTAVGDGTYTYKLSGRLKAGTAGFEVVVDGTADPRNGDLQGNGNFTLDLDAAKRVNPVDSANDKGKIDAHYDLSKKHLDLTIDSTDAAGAPVNADYAYDEAADGGGQMLFTIAGNAGGGPANEQIALRSRWQSTGAGRADARVAGGDLGSLTATASECWDTSFQQIYYIDSISSGGTLSASEGVEASCAFPAADLPAAP
ncbi:MAG TPA: hypothetical protein VGC42_24205 [Kofleriaceae bacterium]